MESNPVGRKSATTSRSRRTIGVRGNEEEERTTNPNPTTIEGEGGKGKRKRQTSNPNPNPVQNSSTVPARMTRSSSRIGVVEEKRNRQMAPRSGKAAVTSNRNPNPGPSSSTVPRSPSPRSPSRSPDPNFERYNFGNLYDDIQIIRLDKEIILRDCEAKLQTSRNEANKKLESLASFLRGKGIGTGKTSQETYEEALKLFIEGNLEGKLKKDVAGQIQEYVARRIVNASMILIKFPEIDCDEYDARVVGLIVAVLEDLKDIKLTAPELDAAESLARVYLNVPQEAQAVMGRAVRDRVNEWTLNSRAEYEMMRVWAESPTWVIDTGRHDHLVLNPY